MIRQLAAVIVAVSVASAAAHAATPGKEHGQYYCDADWNNNGRKGESADVIACIRGALRTIKSLPDGLDNAITINLPSGRFDVSAACSEGICFRLKSGIQIV